MGEQDWKEYDYTIQLGPNASMVTRPLLQVEISCRTSAEKVQMMAMIDSGTDSTVLHADIARTLGISLENCQKTRLGGVGTYEAYITNIKVKVPDFGIETEGPVIFVEELRADVLLGQRDFFEKFHIRFEKSKGKFYLASAQN